MARIRSLESYIKKAYDLGFKMGRMQNFNDSLKALRSLTDGTTKKRQKPNNVSTKESRRRSGPNSGASKNSGRNSRRKIAKTNRDDAVSREHTA